MVPWRLFIDRKKKPLTRPTHRTNILVIELLKHGDSNDEVENVTACRGYQAANKSDDSQVICLS